MRRGSRLSRRRGGEEQATDIKSNNPHLAGGEKQEGKNKQNEERKRNEKKRTNKEKSKEANERTRNHGSTKSERRRE